MKKLLNFRSCRIYDSLNQLLLVKGVVYPGILFICIITIKSLQTVYTDRLGNYLTFSRQS